LKRLLLVLLLAASALAQTNPVTPAFPSAVVSDDQLTYFDDFGSTTLSSSVGASDATIFITSAVGFLEPSIISICPVGECSNGNYTNAELVAICGISGTTLTVCSNGRDIGDDCIGSATGNAFANGSVVELVPTACALNRVRAEVKAIQTALGANLANVAETADFDTEAELETLLTDVTNLIVSTEIDSVAELEALAGAVNLITSTEVDSIAELEALLGAVNVLLSTEIDTSAEVAGIVGDETGTGALVFNIAPNLRGVIDSTGTPVDDDDCTGQQGEWWYDSTDGQFEFCNADSGPPNVPGSGGGGGGGAVDSVNGQTGTVSLDADDIDDTSTTHKFVTSADITKLGNLSGTNTGDQTTVSGNAGTATALASNPTDCGANVFAYQIDASGNLTCRAAVDADIPNTITIDLAATATALAANGANCSAGSYPLGVDASGAVEGCTAAVGSGDVTGPASSLDNAIPRFDGTGGKTLQESGVTIDDSDNVTVPANLTVDGTITAGSGTDPLSITGYTDDIPPSAPGTANQCIAYWNRSTELWSWICNGGSAQTAVTTTGTQTVSGKTLTAPVIGSAGGAAPTASGTLQYDSTANALEYGDNGTNRTFANLDEPQTLTNKTIDGNSNEIQSRRASNCTALTDGVIGEVCADTDDGALFVCIPSAGACDTAGEWKAQAAAATPACEFPAYFFFGVRGASQDAAGGVQTGSLAAGNVGDIPYASMTNAATLQAAFKVPDCYTGQALDFTLMTTVGTLTGAGSFDTQTGCMHDDEPVALNTAQNTAYANSVSASNDIQFDTISGLTMTGCSARDLMVVKLTHNAGTLSANGRYIGFTINEQ
jgi:hypothetical protein